MDFRADLHCHSVCSDGSYLPKDLLLLAKQVGLSGLSITDHDTLAAYSSELFVLAKELQIELLPGVEISSFHRGQRIDILAYGNRLFSSEIHELIEKVQEFRIARNQMILAKLAQKGCVIHEEDLWQSDREKESGDEQKENDFRNRNELKPSVTEEHSSPTDFLHQLGVFARDFKEKKLIGRLHIANAMVKKGFSRSINEAFDSYLKEGASCCVSGGGIGSLEVVQLLHKSNIKVILAHPHKIRSATTVRELLEMPFDGLEGHYSLLLPTDEEKWIRIAKKKGWIVSGGSEFHGAFRSSVPLGCSWVTKEVFQILSA